MRALFITAQRARLISHAASTATASIHGTGSPAASKRLCCGSLCKYAAIALGDASAFVQHPVPGFPKLKARARASGRRRHLPPPSALPLQSRRHQAGHACLRSETKLE